MPRTPDDIAYTDKVAAECGYVAPPAVLEPTKPIYEDPRWSQLADWFAEHILPLEPTVRAWLRKAGWGSEDVEDLMQETYARLAAHPLAEIAQPKAYVFATVRIVAAYQLRRRQVVTIRSAGEPARPRCRI